MPVITAALFARFASRQEDSPAMKVVAALRNQFGGHAVTAAGGPSPARLRRAADVAYADVDQLTRPGLRLKRCICPPCR